jgi:hypothetical protein
VRNASHGWTATLDTATTLSVVSILKGLCHLNDVRADQRHVHIHQVTCVERTTNGEESEKGKEGYSDKESRQEDERQEEEITGASLPPRCLQLCRHLKRRGERC